LECHEGRFKLAPLDIDWRSQNRNTKLAPKIEKFSPRPELWSIIDAPDAQIYNCPDQHPLEINTALKTGSMKFDFRRDRERGNIYKPLETNCKHEPDYDNVL